MRRTLAAAALTALAGMSAAPATAQTAYTLRPGAFFDRENCLPPCLCPYSRQAGPMTGGFTLTFLDAPPSYTRYTLQPINWRAHTATGPIDIVGGGIYTIGGQSAPVHRIQLDLTIGLLPVVEHFDTGFVPVDPLYPFPAISIVAEAEPICRHDTLTIIAAPGPAPCYANCDGSTAAPILNVSDFVCFLSRYAAGDPYANCDGSTAEPVLNVNDFVCFQNGFAAGCS